MTLRSDQNQPTDLGYVSPSPLENRDMDLTIYDKAIALEKACQATLLFFDVGVWDDEKRDKWWNLTQSTSCDTKTLCDFVRSCLPSTPLQ